MEKLRETGGAVAGEGTPGFAGGPEPGTAASGESRSGAKEPKAHRRRFTAAERASLVRRFLESGETLDVFSARQVVSLSTLSKWRQRYLEGGEAGLQDHNERNRLRRLGAGNGSIPASPSVRRTLAAARSPGSAVAVARKLAVLLHRLWSTGEVYDPNRVLRLTG